MRINPAVVSAASRRVDAKLGKTGAAAAKMPPTVALSGSVKTYIAGIRTHDDVGAFERAIGTNDLLSLGYFWQGLHASRSVGRIMIAATDAEPAAAATGFMIAPNVLLTNWHVFPDTDTAKRARIEFGYEADENGGDRMPTWFSLNPDRLFIARETLDFSLVYVEAPTQEGPDPLPSFGWLRLNPQLGKTAYGQYLSIIQHPEAQAKQIAIRENKLLPFDDSDDFLTYQSDTFRGSSGSPVFNDFWEVCALHHSGKPAMTPDGAYYLDRSGSPITDHKPSEDEIKWIANEGTRTSRIIANIRGAARAGEKFPDEMRTLLEATFTGTLQPPQPWRSTAPSARNEESSGAAPLRPTGPSDTFLAYLPLNVTIRVENADHPSGPKMAAASATPQPIPQAGEPLLEKLNFDQDYEDRRGYDETFLGKQNPAPMPTIVKDERDQIAPLKDKSTQLDYHHYSALVHKTRRMPVLTACNVDYEDSARGDQGRASFGKDQWILDSRMDERYQIPTGFYDRWKKIDYGHLVRREDNCWGASQKEIEYSNSDTFHLTNCTPQHEDFNRSNLKGIWGLLENAIGDQSKKDKGIARLCVFAGPIFDDEHDLVCDDKAGKILVPLAFWKVVVAPLRKGGLGAYGFVLSQADVLQKAKPFEEFVPPQQFRHEQTTLAAIEARTIVRFDKALKAVDIVAKHATADGGNESVTLSSVEDLVLA